MPSPTNAVAYALVRAASRLIATLALLPLLHAAPPTYAILSDDPGGWPLLLQSVGFMPQPAAAARIFVLRAGSAGSPEWPARVENGAYLILEGESSAAESFGFRPTKENVRVASLQDVHLPKLPIVWEKGLELPRYEVPAEAKIFAKERWTGAPLLAGFRRGAGAVLWVEVSPGARGYERFPYLLHALVDLGLDPPFSSDRLWAFFDSSYRLRVDLDYFAARWRNAGISALHVAAWHFYDADPERDAYLQRLIAACHANGILVYAWLELPHVSEKFWDDHPQWREKTAVLQDAQLDWRKLMNLSDPDCFRAAAAGVKDLIGRFDWDGVNLAELYFESLEGLSNPSRFTPMNDTVRAQFRATPGGFDPIELFQARKDVPSQRAFLDFRAALARDMQRQWLAEIESIRRARNYLDIVLTHVDDRLDTTMRDAIGADSAQLLPLLDRHNFTFLIEDPATVWNEAPQRYAEIARRYLPLTPRQDRLAIDLNIVDRYQNVYPTKQQTGAELFEVVHSAAGAFAQVALYFENSILSPDLSLLPASAAVVIRMETIGTKLMVDSPHGVALRWTGAAMVDSLPWPVRDGSLIFLPAGAHSVEAGADSSALQVTRFNGGLTSAQSVNANTIELSYKSSARAIAILNHTPVTVEIDGAETQPDPAGPNAIFLPRGQHLVTIQSGAGS
ncbi:MAG: hypothetical protein ABSF64_09785 [Bryobacteraceae bacterium]|jgi:hypothetical protein